MQGPLGAIAFAVLKGLQTAGASQATVEDVFSNLKRHLCALSDDDSRVLCQVVETRLAEAHRDHIRNIA
ncbi:MAG: hypothetical protein H6707_05590 [Deltaproteobacteria bacterium]|nr:hypothetical protein [Deltaproteobacteria bacterium]